MACDGHVWRPAQFFAPNSSLQAGRNLRSVALQLSIFTVAMKFEDYYDQFVSVFLTEEKWSRESLRRDLEVEMG